MKSAYTYILTNKRNTVLYVGVTTNLEKRMFEHRSFLHTGFTSKYKVFKLVYFEQHLDIRDGIAREKQLKGKSRAKKIALINSMNPEWKNLDHTFPSPLQQHT